MPPYTLNRLNFYTAMATCFFIAMVIDESETAIDGTERASHLNQEVFMRNIPNISSLSEGSLILNLEAIREAQNSIHIGRVVNSAKQTLVDPRDGNKFVFSVKCDASKLDFCP